MASFKALFPRVFTKEALFTPDDATWLKGKSNLLAAVDAHVMVNAPVAAITLWGQVRAGCRATWQDATLSEDRESV